MKFWPKRWFFREKKAISAPNLQRIGRFYINLEKFDEIMNEVWRIKSPISLIDFEQNPKIRYTPFTRGQMHGSIVQLISNDNDQDYEYYPDLKIGLEPRNEKKDFLKTLAHELTHARQFETCLSETYIDDVCKVAVIWQDYWGEYDASSDIPEKYFLHPIEKEAGKVADEIWWVLEDCVT